MRLVGNPAASGEEQKSYQTQGASSTLWIKCQFRELVHKLATDGHQWRQEEPTYDVLREWAIATAGESEKWGLVMVTTCLRGRIEPIAPSGARALTLATYYKRGLNSGTTVAENDVDLLEDRLVHSGS